MAQPLQISEMDEWQALFARAVSLQLHRRGRYDHHDWLARLLAAQASRQ